MGVADAEDVPLREFLLVDLDLVDEGAARAVEVLGPDLAVVGDLDLAMMAGDEQVVEDDIDVVVGAADDDGAALGQGKDALGVRSVHDQELPGHGASSRKEQKAIAGICVVSLD